MMRSDAGVRSIQLRTMLQMEPEPTTTSVSQCAPDMMRGIEAVGSDVYEGCRRTGSIIVPDLMLAGDAV